MVDDQDRLPGSEDTDSSATRRRGARLEEAILDAAWSVFAEQGYHRFTFEAVAARAGTSRPVLYRRWSRREDLLLAAIKRFLLSKPIPVPDTGSLREDAIRFLQNADIGRARMITLLSAQLMDFFLDNGINFSDLRASLSAPGEATPFEIIVSRAVERGELPALRCSPRVVNLPFDLLRYEAFMTMRPLPESAIIEIVDEIWLPLLASHTGSILEK